MSEKEHVPHSETSLKGKKLVVVERGKENAKKDGSSRARATPVESVVPDLDDEAERIFREGMVAMDGRWSAKEQCYHETPDTKTRLATLQLYLAYRHGLPVQRIVRIEHAFKDRHAELLELAQTPSGRDMLLKSGLITPEWLAKNLPAESQQATDSQARDLPQVPVAEHSPVATSPDSDSHV